MTLNSQIISNIHSDIGYFRFKKFDESYYLLTNDIGKFHFLSHKDFNNFIQGNFLVLDSYKELIKKWFIKDSEYEKKMIWSYLMKNNFVWLWPTLHMIVTTLRCNHHCKYCHAAVAPMTAKQFDMSKETADKVLETIFYTNSPALTIEFQGWESLVNWDIVQYITEMAKIRASYLKKQVDFSLVTNLTLMTEEKLRWCIDNGVGISTSLDWNEKNHNNNRTWYDWNSYEKVTYWIQRISNEYKKLKNGRNIWALLTVTKENLSDYKNIIDAYVDLGLDSIFLRWLNPYWFAASDIKNLSYTKEEWLDFYIKSMDYIIELNKTWKKIKESITCIYLWKIFSSIDPNFMDIRSPSGVALWWIAYNYDGKIYASDESRMLWRMWIDDFLMTDMQENGELTYRAMMTSDITKVSAQSSCLDGLPWYNDHVYKPYIWVDIIHNFKTKNSPFVPFATDEKMFLQIGILDYIFQKMFYDNQAKKIFFEWIKYTER